MAQVINTNVSSLIAQRNLNAASAAQASVMDRLSSGLRINSAKDDAAGSGISSRFDAQIRGTNQAIRNANDGVSLAQTAESTLGTVISNLQRVRELALQASNGTNSAVDRAAIDAEAKQLISEISRSVESTKFNGSTLLNGDFTDKTLQIGANRGEGFTFGIADLSVNRIGTADTAGVAASGTSASISGGDLVINGFTVGNSLASDDTASSANKSESAISKAAAINKISDQTGVVADVGTTTAAGTAQGTANTETGSVSINGILINIGIGSVSTAANRAAVVSAINEESGQTGVIAIDTGTDAGGVELVAADGRNIDVGTFAGITAANTGLAMSGRQEGTFTLRSLDGSDIVISEGNGGNITNSGLELGTFSAGQSTISSVTSMAALVTGDLVINGVAITASLATDDNASSANKDQSAISKVAAINKQTETTGVTAVVNETRVLGATVAANTSTGDVTINGVTTAQFSTDGGDVDASRATTVAAINAISAQTGVIATDTGTTVELTAADGRNITTAFTITSTATGLGAAGTTRATLTLQSSGKIELSSTTGAIAINAGFDVGTFGGAKSGQALSELDLSTVAGAQAALTSIDNALGTINSERANLGAIQNRLASTISGLTVNVESLSAANSQILDADFAAETAALSKFQVLQQAGISILAQANAGPQQVLSLLQ